MTAALDVVALARDIAERAHAGQTDKTGQPYIGHVERVAARVTKLGDQAVALLHDVLEDTRLRAADLCAVGVPLDVVDDVELLTHRPHEPRSDYYARILTSERAVRVKLADIADNTDPARLSGLDDALMERLVAKYAKARATLTRSDPTCP